MQPHLVSILMPVYNGEKFLREAIESVLAQDSPDWELVIADDGSKDGSKEIIAAYPDPRIRYFHQENRGQAAALNLALANAQGEFVTTLDADDWLPRDSLSKRVEFLAGHPAESAVYGDGIYCAEDGTALGRFSEYCLHDIQGNLFGYLVISNMFGTGAAVMIRRQAIQHLELRYDESIVWCQDWDFYLRLAAAASFGYVNTATVYYRLHGSNMTMQMPSERQIQSVSKTRQKVMLQEAFSALPTAQKAMFFYEFLRNNLRGRPADQSAVLDQAQFKALPPTEKAKILRFIALDRLLDANDAGLARTWLRQAYQIAPADRKTLLLLVLLAIHPRLAAGVARRYRKGKENTQAAASPYDLVSKPPIAASSTAVQKNS